MRQLTQKDFVMSTACNPAAARALAKLPYSVEIAQRAEIPEAIEKIQASENIVEAIGLEGRGLVTDSIIETEGFSQLIELGSGLSNRGLLFTELAPNILVEIDFPEMLHEKRAIYQQLGQVRPNLHLMPADFRSWRGYQKLRQLLRPARKVGIIADGFFLYFRKSEVAGMLRRCHRILSEYGGCLITDGFRDQPQYDQIVANRTADALAIQGKVDFDVQAYNAEIFDSMEPFQDGPEIVEFLERNGFSMSLRFWEGVVSQLKLPERFGVPLEEIEQRFRRQHTYVLTVK